MSIRSNIIGQFKNPHGPLGHLAGYIMAHRASNIERNAWTLDLLNIAPDDKLLEIGYGPGIGIAMAAERISTGYIVGIDHSKTMFKQASKKNARAIENNQVQLLYGDIQNLCELNLKFNNIWSANVVQFWKDPLAVYSQLREYLEIDGTIATTYMPRHRGASDKDAHRKAEEITKYLERSGYTQISTHVYPLKPICAVSVLAHNRKE